MLFLARTANTLILGLVLSYKTINLGFSFSVGAGWGHGVSHRALSFWPLISAAQHGGGTSIPPNDVVPI